MVKLGRGGATLNHSRTSYAHGRPWPLLLSESRLSLIWPARNASNVRWLLRLRAHLVNPYYVTRRIEMEGNVIEWAWCSPKVSLLKGASLCAGACLGPFLIMSAYLLISYEMFTKG